CQSGLRDGVEAPRTGDALQLVFAAILEFDPRSRNERRHGARYDDLAGTGSSHDPCADVHGDPAHVLPAELDLARVKARSHVDAEGADALVECDRAPDGAG